MPCNDSDRPLTPTMRRHLRELAAIGPEAAWGPESSGEWRCAEALVLRGLLDRNVSRGSRPFSLTARGYAVAAALPGFLPSLEGETDG